MKFNDHNKLAGLHAPFGASKSSWLRYDDDKLIDCYLNMNAAVLGTQLHEWAKTTIELGIKQPRSKKTLYSYVNDAIGFNLKPEIVLFVSENFFGTADAIGFNNNILRISDLKTGKTPAKMEQLEIYAAYFCIEYRINPKDIKIELRIYQNDEILYDEPDPQMIQEIINKVIYTEKLLSKIERR